MPAEETPTKICPKCKKAEATTFSTCRGCGTRYDFKPVEQTKEVNLGIPLLLLTAIGIIGASAYAYVQIQNMYKHPDKLIGKTLQCETGHMLASVNKEDMLSLDGELAEAASNDPKTYGNRSVGGILSAASALNSMSSGKETKYSLLFKYIYAGRLHVVSSSADRFSSTDEPLKVSVIGATGASDKFPLIQVKVLNGPKTGTIWWANTDQLALSAKDR